MLLIGGLLALIAVVALLGSVVTMAGLFAYTVMTYPSWMAVITPITVLWVAGKIRRARSRAQRERFRKSQEQPVTDEAAQMAAWRISRGPVPERVRTASLPSALDD